MHDHGEKRKKEENEHKLKTKFDIATMRMMQFETN
jgi:hypothetical protein